MKWIYVLVMGWTALITVWLVWRHLRLRGQQPAPYELPVQAASRKESRPTYRLYRMVGGEPAGLPDYDAVMPAQVWHKFRMNLAAKGNYGQPKVPAVSQLKDAGYFVARVKD